MEKVRYDKLKCISLEKSGIIKNSLTDPIYKFCVLNRIDNLGDFIDTYNRERINMDKRYSLSYFDGVIDLINLLIFKEELPEEKNLNKKIRIFKNDNSRTFISYVESDVETIGRTENISLKRLGFNNKESKDILRQVLCIGKEVTVIEAIKSCIENFNVKKMNSDDEMFISKLHILYQYYENHNKNNNEVNFKDAEDKAIDLYKRMLVIQKELIECYCEFKEIVSKLPDNDKKVKSLVRKFEQFNCK